MNLNNKINENKFGSVNYYAYLYNVVRVNNKAEPTAVKYGLHPTRIFFKEITTKKKVKSFEPLYQFFLALFTPYKLRYVSLTLS